MPKILQHSNLKESWVEPNELPINHYNLPISNHKILTSARSRWRSTNGNVFKFDLYSLSWSLELSDRWHCSSVLNLGPPITSQKATRVSSPPKEVKFGLVRVAKCVRTLESLRICSSVGDSTSHSPLMNSITRKPFSSLVQLLPRSWCLKKRYARGMRTILWSMRLYTAIWLLNLSMSICDSILVIRSLEILTTNGSLPWFLLFVNMDRSFW